MFRRLLSLMPVLGAALLVFHGAPAAHTMAFGHYAFHESSFVGIPFE